MSSILFTARGGRVPPPPLLDMIFIERKKTMSADLHLHVFDRDELKEEDFRCFFRNIIGSKWSLPIENIFSVQKTKCEELHGTDCVHWDNISNSINIWVGSVSWLKAALFEDGETFVPDTVNAIHELVGEDLKVIDDELIRKIADTFDLQNKTQYDIAKKEDIENFLIQHKGKKIFTISW